MNCPCCGKEMKSGYTKSAKPIVWSTNNNLVSTKGFLLTQSLWKGYWSGYSVPSWLCVNCGMVLTPVEVRKEQVED